jgi:hypothetical protein
MADYAAEFKIPLIFVLTKSLRRAACDTAIRETFPEIHHICPVNCETEASNGIQLPPFGLPELVKGMRTSLPVDPADLGTGRIPPA